jgi:hypothetical protein
MTSFKRAKTFRQFIWAFLKPFWPFFRWTSIKMGFVTQIPERQRFHLGYLKKGISFGEFAAFLKKNEFEFQRMAFIDPDEFFGMRRLDDKDPTYQYHVRAYKDMEIRGHYERTPEDFPIDHLNEVGLVDRADEFFSYFGDFVERR